jgi:DNA-directed RNA polymerase specialized sigma24 family protein
MAKKNVFIRIGYGSHRQKSSRTALAPPNRYQSVDWADLNRRLRLYARMLIGGLNVVVDCGVSADDLVSETIAEFFQSTNGLGWRESKGSLPAFLGAVLRNKLRDHIRRDKKIVRPGLDTDRPTCSDVTTSNLDDDLAIQNFTAGLLKLLKGRDDEEALREFILAGSMIGGGGKVNQQLAELMGVGVGEVVNLRKRLWRAAGIRELYEEFRHGRKADESIDQSRRAIDGQPA